AWLATAPEPAWLARLELGLQHEQQHQELLLTDIKYILATNPLRPAYAELDNTTVCVSQEHPAQAAALGWREHAGGVVHIGHNGEGFGFDNEGARHAVLLQPFGIADRLVSNAEYAAFIDAGGYGAARHWHAEGWDWCRQSGQRA